MRLKEFIRAKKTIVDAGKWLDKKPPKTGGPFPLSKSKSVRLGDQWDCRFVKLEANDKQYVLLIGVREAKQELAIYLGVRIGDGSLVIARLEYHATHPGIHVHGCCGTHESGWISRTHHPGMRRIPAKAKNQRRMLSSITRESALKVAAEKFKIDGLVDPKSSDSGQGELFE